MSRTQHDTGSETGAAVPEEHEGDHARHKSAMNCIDGENHLHARGTREGLADSKNLLVLRNRIS